MKKDSNKATVPDGSVTKFKDLLHLLAPVLKADRKYKLLL
jgi:hypothetical protein